MDSIHHELNTSFNQNVILELDAGAVDGLKKMPVDMFDGIYLGKAYNNALCLCIDIRNFSDFLCSHTDDIVFKLIKEFTSNLLSCINQFGYGCSYYKFLGDGVLVIWDETSKEAIKEALYIFKTYSDFLDEELFKPYDTLSLCGALVEEKVFKYEISAEVSQLKYRDYVGYGINLACRLQTVARVNELLMNEKLVISYNIRHRVNNSPEILRDLDRLKGLRDDDRKRALIFQERK